MGSIFTFIIIITILIYLIPLGIFIYNSKNKKINEIEKWVLIFIFVISIVLSLTFLMIEKNDIDKQMAQQTNIRPIIEINIEMLGWIVVKQHVKSQVGWKDLGFTSKNLEIDNARINI